MASIREYREIAMHIISSKVNNVYQLRLACINVMFIDLLILYIELGLYR